MQQCFQGFTRNRPARSRGPAHRPDLHDHPFFGEEQGGPHQRANNAEPTTARTSGQPSVTHQQAARTSGQQARTSGQSFESTWAGQHWAEATAPAASSGEQVLAAAPAASSQETMRGRSKSSHIALDVVRELSLVSHLTDPLCDSEADGEEVEDEAQAEKVYQRHMLHLAQEQPPQSIQWTAPAVKKVNNMGNLNTGFVNVGSLQKNGRKKGHGATKGKARLLGIVCA